MKIITLWRPWGAAIIHGVNGRRKTIETRSHRNFLGLVGQRIGIHNAAKWHRDAEEIMRPYLLGAGSVSAFFRDASHPKGAIIGTVRVAKFLSLTPGDPSQEQAALCPVSDNRFGLALIDPRPLAVPIVTPGAMGIWEHDI